MFTLKVTVRSRECAFSNIFTLKIGVISRECAFSNIFAHVTVLIV